jgi:hypothetical protein
VGVGLAPDVCSTTSTRSSSSGAFIGSEHCDWFPPITAQIVSVPPTGAT